MPERGGWRTITGPWPSGYPRVALAIMAGLAALPGASLRPAGTNSGFFAIYAGWKASREPGHALAERLRGVGREPLPPGTTHQAAVIGGRRPGRTPAGDAGPGPPRRTSATCWPSSSSPSGPKAPSPGAPHPRRGRRGPPPEARVPIHSRRTTPGRCATTSCHPPAPHPRHAAQVGDRVTWAATLSGSPPGARAGAPGAVLPPACRGKALEVLRGVFATMAWAFRQPARISRLLPRAAPRWAATWPRCADGHPAAPAVWTARRATLDTYPARGREGETRPRHRPQPRLRHDLLRVPYISATSSGLRRFVTTTPPSRLNEQHVAPDCYSSRTARGGRVAPDDPGRAAPGPLRRGPQRPVLACRITASASCWCRSCRTSPLDFRPTVRPPWRFGYRILHMPHPESPIQPPELFEGNWAWTPDRSLRGGHGPADVFCRPETPPLQHGAVSGKPSCLWILENSTGIAATSS
jgi:hypothetical protein